MTGTRDRLGKMLKIVSLNACARIAQMSVTPPRFSINCSFRAHNRSRNCRVARKRERERLSLLRLRKRDEKFCFFRPKPLCRRTNFSAFHLECSQHYHFMHLTTSTILSTMRGFLGNHVLMYSRLTFFKFIGHQHLFQRIIKF